MGKIAHEDLPGGFTEGQYEGDSHHLIGGVADLDIVRSASKVLAANDSSAADKAMADDVCSGANDEVNIQAAIDALASGTRGTIYLAAGIYEVSAPITLKNSANIKGAGMTDTRIHGNGDITVFVKTADAALRRVELSDLRIYHDSPASTGDGIQLVKGTASVCSSQLRLSRVRIDYYTRGIYLDNPILGVLDQVNCYNCTTGFFIGDTAGTSMTLIGCYAIDCTIGYRIKELVYSTLISCACDRATTAYRLGADNVGDAMEYVRIVMVGCGCEEAAGNAILGRQMYGPLTIIGGEYHLAAGGNRDGVLFDGNTGAQWIQFHNVYLTATGTGKLINMTGQYLQVIGGCPRKADITGPSGGGGFLIERDGSIYTSDTTIHAW